MAPKTSNDIQLERNEAYKSGDFDKAISLYLEALKLDPSDHAPLSNITAVRYESGNYEATLRDIDEALQKEKAPAKVLQLSLRRLRCYFQLGKADDVVKEADRLLGTDYCASHKNEIVRLEDAAKRMMDEGWKGRETGPIEGGFIDHKCDWKDCHEFFPRGHDDAEPLVSKSQMQLLGQHAPLDLALFYGGFGDGQHFYQQIHHFMAYDRACKRMEKEKGPPKQKGKNKYFFTLVDHQPHALARTLVMLRLLYDVGTLPRRIEGLKERTREKYKTLCTFWYIFAADIMPRFAYDRLTATMTKLRDGNDFGIAWIRADEDTSAAIRKVYDTWLGPANDLYDVEYAQAAFQKPIVREDHEYMDKMWPFIKMEWELKQYKKTLVMIPPRDVMRLEESELREILTAETSEADKIKKIREHAKRNWKINMTMYDPDNAKSPWMKPWTDSAHILGNMTNYQRCMSEERMLDALFYLKHRNLKTLGSVEAMAVYFKSIAEWLARNTDSLTVEYRLGEVYATVDLIHYSPRPANYPRFYDAIHLSNIPDYTGGHLTTTLHAHALLKPHGFLQFNCLANTGLWFNLDHAISEYLGLPSLSAATRYLGISLAPGEEYDPSQGWMSMPPDYR